MDKHWYKLTNEHGETFGGTKWGIDVTHEASGPGVEFCSPDLIHLYEHPLVALLHNPMHAGFKNPLVWLASASGPVYSDLGLKHGAKRVTTHHTLPTPDLSTEVHVHYAILCAKQVLTDIKWTEWANNWLSGKDRSRHAAHIAARAADASHAATYAAAAATYAADAADAAYAVSHAAYAEGRIIDFPALAEQAFHAYYPNERLCLI